MTDRTDRTDSFNTSALDLANVPKSHLNPDLVTIGQTERDAHDSPGQTAQVGSKIMTTIKG